MATIRKFVGKSAISFSIIYNFFLLILLFTYILRGYDDCSDDKPPEGENVENCNAAFAIYILYLPSVLAAPLIVWANFSNVYYLEWWLLLQVILCGFSCLIYMSYSPFYDTAAIWINLSGIVLLVLSFLYVAMHLLAIKRSPPPPTISEGAAETQA